MRRIEIITTQNVRIEYELANLRDRFLGWLIDVITMVIGCSILVFIAGAILNISSEWVYMALWFFPIILYTPVFEILNNGQSLGKMALKTKVVTVNGKNPEALDYIIRWAFRMTDIYMTAGSLGAILVSSSEKAQRLGGVLSNTTVVRLEARRHLALEKLLSITSAEEYVPIYPQVRMMSEKDMLTVKSTLDRYSKYRNSAHKEAVLLVSDRVEEELGIERGQLGHMAFLKTLIKDYIVLTR